MEFSINKNPEVIRHIVKDDGTFPNSGLYILIYKKALELPEKHAAQIVEDVFKKNNWTNAWKNGIYDYHHYHSVTHEVLGVYEGSTMVQLGGPDGMIQEVEKGDIIIIPAGVAHKNVGAENDFKCVGAYPEGRDYDIKKGDAKDRPEVDKNIKNVPLPEKDPVYGSEGPLILNWEVW
jgi:Uncharacterized protein containing double-stranded beta helix domain